MSQPPRWTDALVDDNDDWQLDSDKFEVWLEDHDFVPHPSRLGEWITGECPDCGSGVLGKDWRFMVHADKGLLSCFGCGLPNRDRADPFELVMDVDGVDLNEARRLIGSVDIITVETAFEEAPAPGDRFITAEEVTAPDASYVYWWDGQALPAEWMEQALQACMQRGYTREFLAGKSIGFATDGRYYGRVVIPVFTNNRFSWLQAWDWCRKSDIKYHSPKRGDGMLRQNIIYQLDQYAEAEFLVVLEGMFNAWAVEMAGFPAVATFGKGMTDAQLALLLQSKATKIVLAYDADARAQAARKAKLFRSYGKDVLLVNYPDDKDMDDHHVADVRRLVLEASAPHWFDDAPAAKFQGRRPGAPPKF